MTTDAGANPVDAGTGERLTRRRPDRRPGAIAEGDEIRYSIRTPTADVSGTGLVLKVHRRKGRVHSYVVGIEEDRMIVVFPDEVRR